MSRWCRICSLQRWYLRSTLLRPACQLPRSARCSASRPETSSPLPDSAQISAILAGTQKTPITDAGVLTAAEVVTVKAQVTALQPGDRAAGPDRGRDAGRYQRTLQPDRRIRRHRQWIYRNHQLPRRPLFARWHPPDEHWLRRRRQQVHRHHEREHQHQNRRRAARPHRCH